MVSHESCFKLIATTIKVYRIYVPKPFGPFANPKKANIGRNSGFRLFYNKSFHWIHKKIFLKPIGTTFRSMYMWIWVPAAPCTHDKRPNETKFVWDISWRLLGGFSWIESDMKALWPKLRTGLVISHRGPQKGRWDPTLLWNPIYVGEY